MVCEETGEEREDAKLFKVHRSYATAAVCFFAFEIYSRNEIFPLSPGSLSRITKYTSHRRCFVSDWVSGGKTDSRAVDGENAINFSFPPFPPFFFIVSSSSRIFIASFLRRVTNHRDYFSSISLDIAAAVFFPPPNRNQIAIAARYFYRQDNASRGEDRATFSSSVARVRVPVCPRAGRVSR